MIFYFSATGNSLHAAQTIAQAIGEEQLIAIDECVRNEQYTFSLGEGEILGICCPTYDWGIPNIVKEFLEHAVFNNVNYCFALTTYGTTSGQSVGHIRRLLLRQSITLSASFTLQCVDVWTPMFNLTDKAKNQQLVNAEKPQLDNIIVHIRQKDCGNFAHHQLPTFIAKILYKGYDKKRRTSHLHVTDACIGCGLCAKKCPRQAITMVDKHPTWTKEQCEMCLGCLHRCPKFAIQYDNKTQHHGQYLHKQYEK